MKALLIHFFDTNETLTLNESCDIFAFGNCSDAGMASHFTIEFNEQLPDLLRKKPLMFYVYDDVAIVKLYRSAYIDRMEWV